MHKGNFSLQHTFLFFFFFKRERENSAYYFRFFVLSDIVIGVGVGFLILVCQASCKSEEDNLIHNDEHIANHFVIVYSSSSCLD